MKRTIVAAMLLALPALLCAQSGSINNTLGTGGTFTIKDGSTTFLSLSQSTGYLSLNNCLTLPATTSSTVGVIFKGANRFIHNYTAPSTDGWNTFVGEYSGNFTMAYSSSHFDASHNTAVGFATMTSLTMGYCNSALGDHSLQVVTSGNSNSAFGYEALSHTGTGYWNTAVGSCALCANTDGSNNSALGFWALYQATSGANSAFGYRAGYDITTGVNNTLIGYNAQPSAGDVSNEITLGDGGIGWLRCQVTTITAISDARDKKNIKELPLGLDFLMKLKPRQFNWDRRDWYDGGKSDGSKMQTAPSAGFIAQELDEVQTKEGAEWLNLVLKSNPDRLEATPGNLLPIMVKAIQELKIENEALKNEVAKLRSSIAEQVKKEVIETLLKAVQQEDLKTKVSLNHTKD